MVGLNITPSQAKYAMSFEKAEDFAVACERGRFMAAISIASDPEKKLEMESRFGIEFCRQRWPEAYQER